VFALCIAGSSAATSSAESSQDFVVPNDPYLGQQWYLFNWGQTVGGEVVGTKDVDIRAPEAWSITKGSRDVIVAILDTGADYDHPDLASSVWTNRSETGADGGGRDKKTNGVDDDANGYVDDWRGWDFADKDNDPSDVRGPGQSGELVVAHGTSVASLVAAPADDGVGMAGIAPKVTVMLIRAPEIAGPDLVAAVRYATKNGAQIVNMSFGCGPVLCDGFTPLADEIKATPNVLYVTAAPNVVADADDGKWPPCSFRIENLICVASTDQDDALATFFSGETGHGLATVQLAAPGDNMLIAQPPLEEIWKEDFETSLDARWQFGGSTPAWGVTSAKAGSGTKSLTDSPNGNTLVGADVWASPVLPNIANRRDCRLSGQIWAKSDYLYSLEFRTGAGDRSWNVSIGKDRFAVPDDTGDKWQPFNVPIVKLSYPNFGFRFRMNDIGRNGGTKDGIYIDDLSVKCAALTATYSGRDYAFVEGNSYATPLTSGTAALVRSKYPNLSAVQVKQAILAGTQPVAALVGKVATGGRLDAYGALLAAGKIAKGETVTVPAPAVTSTTRPTTTTTLRATTTTRPAGGIIKALTDTFRSSTFNPELKVPNGRAAAKQAAANGSEGAEGPAGGRGISTLLKWLGAGTGVTAAAVVIMKLIEKNPPAPEPQTAVGGIAAKLPKAGAEAIGIIRGAREVTAAMHGPVSLLSTGLDMKTIFQYSPPFLAGNMKTDIDEWSQVSNNDGASRVQEAAEIEVIGNHGLTIAVANYVREHPTAPASDVTKIREYWLKGGR
jgi:subtilisin family serine protease